VTNTWANADNDQLADYLELLAEDEQDTVGEAMQEAARRLRQERNPYCTHRSDNGDACGICAGCLAEGRRLRLEQRTALSPEGERRRRWHMGETGWPR
jgi:hypothetical protein